MELLFLETDEKWTSAEDFLFRQVPSFRQEKILQYKFNIDRKLSLYAFLLVYAHMPKSLLSDFDATCWDIGAYGKPYIINRKKEEPFFFNISHTRNAVLCALSKIEEIGCDIEKIQEPPGIASFVFHPDEMARLTSCSHGNDSETFFTLWTKKEAYIKKEGKGLSMDLPSFDVFALQNVYFNSFSYKGYLCSTCSQEDLDISFEEITTEQLLSIY